MAGNTTRRAALLGGAGLLGGCEFIDNIIGERRQVITGERRDVLQNTARRLSADAGLANTPVDLPPAAPRDSWPQPGGNAAHSGGNPALGPTLTRIWSADFGWGNSYRRRITSPPVAADGSAFTVDAFGGAAGIDLATGSRRWRRSTAPENETAGIVGGGVSYEGGTLYLASGLGEIMAMDPANGEIKWRHRIEATGRGAPAISNGRLFLPTVDNRLHAFSTEDGRRIWSHRAQAVPAMPLGLPTPAVDGDIVVCGFGSGELSGLRSADGRLVWSETLASANRGALSEVSGIHAMPSISEGRVVALGMGGITICIDLRSGRRVWEREVGGTEGAWIAGNWVFLVTSDEQLACLGRDDGRVRWVTELRPAQTGRRAPPPATWCPPIVAGGRLLIAGSGAELLTVDVSSGAITQRQGLPAGVAWQPAVIGDLLLVATTNGTLVAFRGT